MHEINIIPKFKDTQNNIDSMNSASRIFGVLTVAFVLGLSVFYPVFSKYDVQVMPVKEQQLDAVGQGENNTTGFNPYYYQPPSGYGTFGKWLLNSTMVKGWLKDNFFWRLQASGDGNVWSDANQLLSIGMVWNDSSQSYKITLTLDTTNAPKALFYRFDLACNASLKSYVNDTGNSTWLMNIPTASGRNMTVFFNWSDIKPLVLSGKVTYKHGTINRDGQDYFWFRIQTVNKINKNIVFVVDPVYGTIGDAVTDSWEYDAQESRHQNTHFIERLGASDYYLVGATGDTGTDNDGFLRVLKVWSTNGTIKESVVDSWEFDTDDSNYVGVYHISGDVYAVLYHDVGAGKGKIFTTTAWSSNGSLKKNIIDTFTLAYAVYLYPTLIYVSGDVYAMIYTETATYDQQLDTINISSAGVIGDTVADTIEIDSTSTGTNRNKPHGCMVDSDTIAVVWQENVGYDVWAATYNISNTGNIGNTYADLWEFDTRGTSSSSAYPYIHKVSVNTFAVVYTTTSDYSYIITFNITNSGNLLGIIDSLLYDGNVNGGYFSMFTVNDASTTPGGQGVYGIVFAQNVNLWRVCTVNISYGGIIPATKNDALNLNAYDTTILASSQCVYMAGNYYLLVDTDNNADGWVYTFTIETYQVPSVWSNVCPIAKGEHPTNSSTGVVLKPAVGCTITDGNSNHTMNVTFATNSSGTWKNFQTNSSVANNSAVNWTMSMAGTGNSGYSWRVYVHDGICNQTYTYSFTTKANVTATWHIVDNTITGSAYNKTQTWKIIDNTITGSAFNRTATWHIVDNAVTGSAFNRTATWHIVDSSITGSAHNTTGWHVIDSSITGSAHNTTGWHTIDSSITGGAYNRTLTWHIIDSGITGGAWNKSASWYVIDNTITGSAYNKSATWHVVDSSITGSAHNTTGWHIIDNTITGSAFNRTQTWHIIDNTTIGGAYNRTSSWYIIDNTITGSAYNLTLWHIIDNTITGGAYNSSAGYGWHVVDNTISGSAFNKTLWHIIDDTIIGSAFNKTQTWHTIDNTISGNAYNISTWFIVDNTITGNAFNRTQTWHIIDSSITGNAHGSPPTWHIVDSTITGSAHNNTVWHIIDNTITGNAHNITAWYIIDTGITGNAFNISNIVISNVYPINNSNLTGLQPTIYFNITSSYGLVDYLIYVGDNISSITTLLCSVTNVTNGTYYYPYILATLFNKDYYFRIIGSSTNHTTEVVMHFKTKQPANGNVVVNTNIIWGIIGLIGIFGLIGFLWRKRK